MKSIKTLMLFLATTVAIVTSSCVHEKPSNDDRIDVEKLKTELTKAVGQSINESTQSSEFKTGNNEGNNVTIVADSSSSASASPVINVYVDIPAENSSNVFDDEDNLIAAIAIIMIFAVPCITFLLIVIAILVFVYKRNRNRNAVIQQAIEAGYPLPETFYNNRSHSDKNRDSQLLQRGIRNIGVGVLLCISFTVFFGIPFVGVMCLIPAVIGIGELVTYYSSDKNNVNNADRYSNND